MVVSFGVFSFSFFVHFWIRGERTRRGKDFGGVFVGVGRVTMSGLGLWV